jgi:hypothetical protein
VVHLPEFIIEVQQEDDNPQIWNLNFEVGRMRRKIVRVRVAGFKEPWGA